MKLIPRGESIAWHFVAVMATAVLLTVGLAGLFFAFGGIWAAPSIQDMGLVRRAADIADLVEAAPPEMRPTLLGATDSFTVRISWFPVASQAAAALEAMKPPRESAKIRAQMREDREVRVFRPENPASAVPALSAGAVGPGYAMALRLSDGSWMLFNALNRVWGLDPATRWIIWVTVLLIATIAISLVATRQMVKPIQRFADAILLFGSNPKTPPLAEIGPKEFRRVISAFNTMQNRIQRLIDHRTAMLAAISHDLRTPLTRIRLRGEFIHDPVQQERLFRDVDELQQMVDGVLAFFRGDAQEEKLTTLDLPSLLQTIVDDFADHGVVLTYQGPARLSFPGRPIALRRAIANLVENAVKYAAPPDIALAETPERLVITVRDRGPGIPEEALEQVFTPFFRLEKSRNRTTGGVGLGLTAARTIIREHGGDIRLANLADGGIEALITLPRLPGL